MIEIDTDEKIERVIRKHWFILLGNIVILFFAVAIPIILLFVTLIASFPVSGAARAAEVFFLFAWLLIIWMIGWKIWADYYLDVLVVTDKRIFDIEQIGFFRRDSSSFRIDRIQNVSVTVDGIMQTYFDFGTMRIETAGEKEQFVSPYIAQPYEVKKFINEEYDRALEKTQVVRIATDDTSEGGKVIKDPTGVS